MAAGTWTALNPLHMGRMTRGPICAHVVASSAVEHPQRPSGPVTPTGRVCRVLSESREASVLLRRPRSVEAVTPWFEQPPAGWRAGGLREGTDVAVGAGDKKNRP